MAFWHFALTTWQMSFDSHRRVENHKGKQNTAKVLHSNCLPNNDNVSRGQVTLKRTTQCVVYSYTSDPKLHIFIAANVHGSWTEGGEVVGYMWIWGWAKAGKRGWSRSTGFVQGDQKSLWSYCSPQRTAAKLFTYWLMPCYRDGGNRRAIGMAANRATHLNTRGQRGSGSSKD